MAVFTLTATAGPDDRLRLDLPAAAGEYTVDVVLTPALLPTPERLGWQPGFFEATAGALPDFAVEPRDQALNG